jgi:hypothetical protein
VELNKYRDRLGNGGIPLCESCVLTPLSLINNYVYLLTNIIGISSRKSAITETKVASLEARLRQYQDGYGLE